jgi:hypothetical protein
VPIPWFRGDTLSQRATDSRNISKNFSTFHKPHSCQYNLRRLGQKLTFKASATIQFFPPLPQESSHSRYPQTSTTVSPLVSVLESSTSTLYLLALKSPGYATYTIVSGSCNGGPVNPKLDLYASAKNEMRVERVCRRAVEG